MNPKTTLTYIILLYLILYLSNEDLKAQCEADSIYNDVSIISQAWVIEDGLISRDFDNDGDNDILFARANPQNIKGIYLMYNLDGLGTFGEEVLLLSTPASFSIRSIASEDIDGDNDYDIIFIRVATGGLRLEILFNLGDGIFSDPFIAGPDVGLGFNDIATGDIDLDGDIDVLVSRQNEDSVRWFENVDGSGENWLEFEVGEALEASKILLDDVNSNGLLDVIVSSNSASYIGWFENLGNQIFSEIQIIANDVTTQSEILFSDINGDGLKDIVGASSFSDIVYNYKSLGGGAFSPRQNISTVDGFRQILSQDMDCDGDLDIVSGAITGLAIHENIDNASTWSTFTLANNESTYPSLVSADLNGDGTDDLIFSSLTNTTIGWYANTCPCSVTSTSNENRISEVKVYPNPATHFITVDFSEEHSIVEAYIYDSTGRLLIETDNLKSNGVLEVQSLSIGYYSLVLISKDGRSGRKTFVKQ